MRPADAAFEEDEGVWVERAREAATRGPLGHHTHWTAPDHARPSRESLVTQCHKGTGERVRTEGTTFAAHGLSPTLFCGGGWYTDLEVAETCAELGYVDCTPRAQRPPYLSEGESWASVAVPTTVALPSGRSLGAIPTTHSLGALARALPRRELAQVVHVYFHDTDLVDARRRSLLRIVLPLLARRARVTDLDTLARAELPRAERVAWDDVARL